MGSQATRLFGSQWFGLVSALMTILILIFSEIIPKTLGTTRWKSLIGFATVMIRGLIFLMYPLRACVMSTDYTGLRMNSSWNWNMFFNEITPAE